MPIDRGDYSPAPPASSPQPLAVPAACAGLRLDQALARLLPQHSRSRLQTWVRDGRVRVDGEAATDVGRRLWGGESLEVHVEEESVAEADRAEAIALDIVFEDTAIMVIDKPAGLVVHPGSGNRSGTLMNALLHHAPHLAGLPRAGIVHRLDKDTTGLMVVAKTLEAQTDLVRQLQARSVSRRYLAVVHGRVEHDRAIDAPIGRHPVQRTRMAVVAGGRAARTHVRVRERFRAATLVECALETGRTHQIRVHMASIGHPLLGDPEYGRRGRGEGEIGRQALHAWCLALVHPASSRNVEWASPLPHDMAQLMARLREARDD